MPVKKTVEPATPKLKPTPKTTGLIFGDSHKDEDVQVFNDAYKEKMIDEVYSRADVELKSDLNNAEIIAITKGKLFAKTFSCPIISDLCDTLLTLKISKDRKGRKEFVTIASSLIAPQIEPERQSIPSRLGIAER